MENFQKDYGYNQSIGIYKDDYIEGEIIVADPASVKRGNQEWDLSLPMNKARKGATTTALGLCGWLRSVGDAVCYVEANASGHLPLLAQSYEMEYIIYSLSVCQRECQGRLCRRLAVRLSQAVIS